MHQISFIDKKQYIITALDKLLWIWPDASKIKTVVTGSNVDESIFDWIIYMLGKASETIDMRKAKDNLSQSINKFRDIKIKNDNDWKQDSDDIEYILETI